MQGPEESHDWKATRRPRVLVATRPRSSRFLSRVAYCASNHKWNMTRKIGACSDGTVGLRARRTLGGGLLPAMAMERYSLPTPFIIPRRCFRILTAHPWLRERALYTRQFVSPPQYSFKMHTRTPGPKQTIPVRLVAGCDNQIGNFPLWGVRWTTPRRRRPRPADSLVHLTTPHTSDSPHTRSSLPASVPVLLPSLTQQGGSVASKSSSVTASNMPSPVDPYTAPPVHTVHGSGKPVSTSNVLPPRPWRDSSAAPAERNVLPVPVLPPPTSTLHSMLQPEPVVADKRCWACLPQGLHIREALPTRNDLPPAPFASGHLSTKFVRPSSSPTPPLPVSSIIHPAPDTLISHVPPAPPSNLVEDSMEYLDNVVGDGNGDIAHAFLAYPPGYILSSHSELAAFASSGDFVRQAEAPDYRPIVSRD